MACQRVSCESSGMVRLQAQLDIDDYLALDTHVWSRPRPRAVRVRIAWGLVAAWCVFTLAFVWSKGAIAAPASLPRYLAPPPLAGGLFAAAGLALLLRLRPVVARWNYRAALRGPGSDFLAPLTYEATARSVSVRSPHGMLERGTLVSIEETPAHLFLFMGPNSAIILPRRGQPAEALDAFRAAAQALVRPP